MKSFLIFPLIFLLSAAPCRCAIPLSAMISRPLESLSTAVDWEVCGTPLTAVECGSHVAYVPLRRRGSPWDEGAVRKVRLEAGAPSQSVLWQTTTLVPRDVLRPAFRDGGFAGWYAEPLENFDPALAEICGLGQRLWNEASALLKNKKMGAPFPASMALAEGILYVLCDDGILCALSARTGRCRWSLLLPQACCRLKYILEARRDCLPLLCTGGLTVESDGESGPLLWGSLGRCGRGLFCLRPKADGTEVAWAKETFEGENFAVSADFMGPPELGLTEAAPLAVSFQGEMTLILPSGYGTAGRLLFFDAVRGELREALRGVTDDELVLTPLGLVDGRGDLSGILCCDASGGIQRFVRRQGVWQADSRLDLRALCALNDLKPRFSPLACRTRRGLTAIFIAEGQAGTVVAGAPAPLKNARWGENSQGSAACVWRQLYEGFSSPFAALCFDGLLYLAGWSDGQRTLLVIDVTPGKAVLSVPLSADVRSLTVTSDGAAAVRSDGSVSAVSAPEGAEQWQAARRQHGIIYTLRR